MIALKGNASSGGTDFIALYVSNKTGRSIWGQVFIGNCVLSVSYTHLDVYKRQQCIGKSGRDGNV